MRLEDQHVTENIKNFGRLKKRDFSEKLTRELKVKRRLRTHRGGPKGAFDNETQTTT